jgi:hypothetical protein
MLTQVNHKSFFKNNKFRTGCFSSAEIHSVHLASISLLEMALSFSRNTISYITNLHKLVKLGHFPPSDEHRARQREVRRPHPQFSSKFFTWKWTRFLESESGDGRSDSGYNWIKKDSCVDRVETQSQGVEDQHGHISWSFRNSRNTSRPKFSVASYPWLSRVSADRI